MEELDDILLFKILDEDVRIALIKGEKKTGDILHSVKDGLISCALMKPSLFCGQLQILSAVQKALESSKKGEILTRTIHTEILYNLSPSKSILYSLNTFTVKPTDEDFLLIQVGPQDGFAKILDMGSGKVFPIRNCVGDENEIKKVYGITNSELEVSNILDCVLTRIALKNVDFKMNYQQCIKI